MTQITLASHKFHSRSLLHWREVKALCAEWRRRIRSRWELQSLDQYDLRDLGLTAADAGKESDKPFWRA